MEINFGSFETILKSPSLTALQRRAYDKFLNERIGLLLKEFSPVEDYNGNLNLHFTNYELILPTATAEECVEKGQTYGAKLIVSCMLENKITGDIMESDVCFGDVPVMTEDNIFILNGITRVILNQIVRAPGLYFSLNKKQTARIVEGVLIAHQGAWLEFFNDSHDVIYLKLNKKKRILITPFLRVLGLEEEEIVNLLGQDLYDIAMKKDKFPTYRESLIEVFTKTKPGEPYSEDAAKNVVASLFCNPDSYTLKEVGRYKLNQKTGLDVPLDCHILTIDDIVASVKEYVDVLLERKPFDDIDHLANRRIRTVGELTEEKFRSGLIKTIKSIKEQISVKGADNITPSGIINPRPLQNSLKEFFMQDQLSQMLEATNPLSETTNKRRVSAIGKGGVNKERAGMEVRDVHYSHYGRLCHIETPDGANIGLISSLAVYADIDKYGFLTTPYRKIDKATKKVLDTVDYLNAADEENFYVAQIDLNYDESGYITDDYVRARHRGETVVVPIEMVDYMDVSTLQTISISASLIPFIHNDDATRAGMGANMMRQAVPLVRPESPLIGTGSEKIMGEEYTKFSPVEGTVVYVDSDRIDIKTKDNIITMKLTNFIGTKKGTCVRESSVVKIGDDIKVGDPISYKYCIDKKNGKLAIGKNVIVAYMPWEGFNYEDSILLSERLVKEDIYTSIHIDKHKVEARETKLGSEEFTNDLVDISNVQKQRLDENGFISIGSKVVAGDIIIGKTTPKGDKELTPEDKLLKAIFGSKSGEVKNSSFKLSHGDWGTITKIKKFVKGDMDLGASVNELVQVTIAKKRKIRVGDKMAGRHGNKGVVSRILPEWEMPYLPDGTPVDIVLNPMGVPSRMNIGQILETHLGLAAKNMNIEYVIPPFDGPPTERIKEELSKAGLPEDGKTILYDGRTGEPFDNKVTVGVAYMLRLSHLVDEKYHARSTGNYSLITQQPLGGKAQFGGQRFGEMEVWALEGYGAANALQEMLTIKSDDVVGREQAAKAILKGEELPKPRLPESFKVLERQMKALGLKLTINGQDDVTLSTEDELKENRFVLDAEINEIIKPWKSKKIKPGQDEDFDEDEYEDDEDDEVPLEESVTEADEIDEIDEIEYTEDDEILDMDFEE